MIPRIRSTSTESGRQVRINPDHVLGQGVHDRPGRREQQGHPRPEHGGGDDQPDRDDDGTVERRNSHAHPVGSGGRFPDVSTRSPGLAGSRRAWRCLRASFPAVIGSRRRGRRRSALARRRVGVGRLHAPTAVQRVGTCSSAAARRRSSEASSIAARATSRSPSRTAGHGPCRTARRLWSPLSGRTVAEPARRAAAAVRRSGRAAQRPARVPGGRRVRRSPSDAARRRRIRSRPATTSTAVPTNNHGRTRETPETGSSVVGPCLVGDRAAAQVADPAQHAQDEIGQRQVVLDDAVVERAVPVQHRRIEQALLRPGHLHPSTGGDHHDVIREPGGQWAELVDEGFALLPVRAAVRPARPVRRRPPARP